MTLNCSSPMQVAQEMVFVWPESGAMAALEAANTKPVLSPYMTEQVLPLHEASCCPVFVPCNLSCTAVLCQSFHGSIRCHQSRQIWEFVCGYMSEWLNMGSCVAECMHFLQLGLLVPIYGLRRGRTRL